MRQFVSATAAVLLTFSVAWQSVPSAVAEPEARGAHAGHRFGEMQTTRVLEMMDRHLDLSDDQRERIGAILNETREALKDPAAETGQIMKESREKVEEILTPEQREKTKKAKDALFAGVGGYMKAHGPEVRERFEAAGDEMKLRAAIGTLDLTEEQRGQLREIEQEVQEKRQAIMEETKPRMEALREEAKGLINQVLTPEQQEQVKTRMDAMPRGGELLKKAHGFKGDKEARGPGGRERRGAAPEQTTAPVQSGFLL